MDDMQVAVTLCVADSVRQELTGDCVNFGMPACEFLEISRSCVSEFYCIHLHLQLKRIWAYIV